MDQLNTKNIGPASTTPISSKGPAKVEAGVGNGGDDTNPIYSVQTIVGVMEDLYFQTLKSSVRP